MFDKISESSDSARSSYEIDRLKAEMFPEFFREEKEIRIWHQPEVIGEVRGKQLVKELFSHAV